MEQHTFTYQSGDSEVTWDLKDVWKAVEGIKVQQVGIQPFIKLAKNVWKEYNDDDLERIKDSDLKYAIIIPIQSLIVPKIIIDGHHRLYKHNELKHKTIPVKALPKMPRPLYCKGKPFKIDGLDFDWYDPRKK